MFFFPALVSLAFLKTNGHWPWMMAVVLVVAVGAYLCDRVLMKARNDRPKGAPPNPAPYTASEKVSSAVTWVHLLVCLAGIALSFVR